MANNLFNNRHKPKEAYIGSLYEKLRDIITVDGETSELMDFEYWGSYIIIKTDPNFPILKHIQINLDEYEYYGYPKHIKIDSKNQFINICFYNDRGMKPALRIDGYTFENISEYKTTRIRFGISPYNTYFRNCIFDIKEVVFFFNDKFNNNTNYCNIPLITSTSVGFEKKSLTLNMESLDLYDKIFDLEKNNNKFIYGKDHYIYLYFFNIGLNIPGIPVRTSQLSDNEIENFNEFLNVKLNKDKKLKGLKITAIGIS